VLSMARLERSAGVGFLPALFEGGVELAAELDGEGTRLAFFVEGDGLADVVHDDLAGVAAGHVLFELLADGRVNGAVHVFVQDGEQFRAFHIRRFWLD
jgi:hypothetical protein